MEWIQKAGNAWHRNVIQEIRIAHYEDYCEVLLDVSTYNSELVLASFHNKTNKDNAFDHAVILFDMIIKCKEKVADIDNMLEEVYEMFGDYANETVH